MADSLSRELILPATRLSVPPRPSDRQLSALAERSPDVWSLSPREWATQQVVRLVVAEVLRSRLAAAPTLPAEPERVTLAQAAHLFGPHVGLARQAFQLAVVEAVNAGVPAAVDPLRESLRRVGVTGREPLRMVALGLDRLPPRAAQQFWSGARTSSTLTAVVGSLAPDSRDVSGLDRSHLARADALVVGGGRTTAVALGARTREGGGSWLPVPVTLARRHRGHVDEPRRGPAGVEVGLRAEGWTEVFEVALDAVGAGMQQLDLGGRPKGRSSGAAEALAQRLVAARDRTAVDVVASLRAIDPFVLEMFDHEVTTSDVRVAVPVPEDEPFVQLWMSPSALAGPLLTGSPDLFLGGGSDVRSPGGRPGGRPGGDRPAKQAQQAKPRPGRSGRRGGGSGKGRPKPDAVPQSAPPADAPGDASA